MADGTHKLKVGFADQLRDIEVALPPGEPKPWDAASKLDVVIRPRRLCGDPARRARGQPAVGVRTDSIRPVNVLDRPAG